MNTLAIILGCCNIFCAIVIYLLCLPLAKGLILRNRTYGFRFKNSMKSDAAWKAVNVYGGKRMMGYSIGIAVIGLVILFIPINTATMALIAGLVPMILLIPSFETWMYSRRIKS